MLLVIVILLAIAYGVGIGMAIAIWWMAAEPCCEGNHAVPLEPELELKKSA